jgi:hypothetical protein
VAGTNVCRRKSLICSSVGASPRSALAAATSFAVSSQIAFASATKSLLGGGAAGLSSLHATRRVRT